MRNTAKINAGTLSVSGGTLSLLSLAVAVTVSSWGCKPPSIVGEQGSPQLQLGGQSGATTVTASVTNPCTIDVDFGDVPIGLTDTVTVQVVNKGSSPLDLSQVNPVLNPEFGLNYGTQQAIQPGEFGQFTATFQPYQVGQVTSTFTIQTDGVSNECPAVAGSSSTNATLTIQLSGNGIQLSLVVQPTVLDFGNTLLNTTEKKTVTLINKSTAPVSAIAANLIGSDANLFMVTNVPPTLAAGASALVDISYSPLALETRSIASVVFGGSDGEKATLTLFGEPVNVALLLAPNPIDFGYVTVHSTVIGCTVATNQSNVPVNISGLLTFETEDNAFAIATTDDATPPNPFSLPITVQPTATAKVCFQFTPPSSQLYNGQVTLQTSDVSNPVVSLTGWGGGPQITCLPKSIDFGQTLDHSITTVPVLCTNTGTAISTTNLLISPPSASPAVFSAQFDATNDTYPLNGLAPGDVAQIDVSYAPTGNSNDKGTLFIKSNGGQGQTIQIPLTGQGLDVPPCQFVIAPSQLDFANVQVGDTSTVLSFEIQNIGADVCFVQGLKIANDLTSSFQILTTSIAPDPTTNKITIPAPGVGVVSNLTVMLDFKPTAQGQAFSAEAAFSISDPSDPNQLVQLTGTSESTCLVITPSSLNFGDVGENDAGVLCTSASRTFQIYNECETPALVQSLTVQNGPGDLTPQFSMPSGPQLPLTIEPGAPPAVYEIFFEPSSLGAHTGQLLASDGTVETLLPLKGVAVSTGTETDSFVVEAPKADILFIMDIDDDGPVDVLDGNGEQTYVAEELPTFIAAATLANIDYRIAITTDNDYPTDASAELGRLLPCPTCSLSGPAPIIITPTSVPAGSTSTTPDPATALTNFWNSVPNDIRQGPDEHFFIALYNALQHGPQPGVDFFRQGSFFAAITDNGDNEADASIGGTGAHNPTWFANFFETYFQNPFLFTWNYINPTETITQTGFSNYLQLPPSIQQMISATNGFALNTSDPHWASALTSVWTSAITAHTYYPLIGSPSEGSTGITVSVNGKNVVPFAGLGDPNWTYSPTLNAIVFNPNTDPPKVGDQIQVTYPIGCK